MKITHSIKEYIREKEYRLSAHARIHNGRYEYNINGKWFSESDFNQLFPRVEYRKFNEKGINPNTKDVS